MVDRGGARYAACCLAVLLLCGVSSAQKGSLTGVVIETTESDGGPPSLLVTVGRAGDPPVSEVRFDLGKTATRDCRASLAPPGWRLEARGGTVVLEGPSTPTPVLTRLEPGAAVTAPGAVNVKVFSDGDRIFDGTVTITSRGQPESNPEEIANLIVLPPALSPGETVATTVIDPDRAPFDGRWRFNDVEGRASLPNEADVEYTVTFDVPRDLGSGEFVELVYVDPFGETTVAADVGSVINVAPPIDAGAPPRIDGGQRYVFIGQTGCVCGSFPTDAARNALSIGGQPVGDPVASSSSVVVFRLPEGLPSGEHAVTVSPSAGFEGPIEREIVALQLSGSVDHELLLRGQSTPMHIEIEGTDERLELRLTNETPEVISLEGGEEGVVTTSGGKPNTVERVVRGVRRGDFRVTYEMANDPCPCGPEGTEASTTVDDSSPVQTGYPVPTGVTLGTPRGTGRTTGHVATITVTNNGDGPVTFPDRPIYIPSDGTHQGYVVPGGRGTTVPPGSTVSVPLEGYCRDVRKPPVAEGESMPDPSEWTVPSDSTTPLPAPGEPGYEELPDEGKIISDTEAIIRATEKLQESGELETPFSSNPERERETVVQQTTWRRASEIDGEPYTKDEFAKRLEEQYEERTGTSIEEAPEEDRQKLEEGIDDFWEAFELVGEQAKVLERDEEAPTISETVPVSEEKPPCDIGRSMTHSDAESDFKMSESYKDEDKRANLREWFGELPQVSDSVEGGTFETSKYPASAWAVSGRDFIGGYCNAVAHHIYAEAGGGTDWVWSTELLEVEARSDGTHVLTVHPPSGEGESCETLVVGAGGGVVEAWSNVIDPIAEHRGLLTALRIVAAVAVGVATAPLSIPASIAATVISVAATEGFNAAFSDSANAAVAVEGQMVVQPNRRRLSIVANSRSTLSGGGDIETDSAKVRFGETSASHATRVEVKTAGLAALKTRASSNGVAEGTVESQLGVAIVGFCRCGGGVQVDFLTDAGLFLVQKGAAGAAQLTAARLEEMVGKKVDDYLKLPADEVIPHARDNLEADLEALLREWYLESGQDEGNLGYFDLKAADLAGP